ncbi:hypothetical protein Taro_017785 [Colocasia esculenta]|uniref:Uncharacterized protein n=1 Tax=Colocasia esculenta TaxID=4460 RepID=A0A843UP37_COLES|nr:hypothetical protein [Colocasia esculenta]
MQDEVPEDDIIRAYQETFIDVLITRLIFDVDITEGINVRVGEYMRHRRKVGGTIARVPLEHYKGKTFGDVVKSTWCRSDNAERNTQNRAHQNMTYQRGRTSIYQLRDDFVKTHQCEPNRMKIFRMERCKALPNSTQQWVDDESNDRFERMTQMMTPALQSHDVTPISVKDAVIAVVE